MKKVPEGWARVCPAVFYEDASKAIDWLCRAFGFEVQLKSRARAAASSTPSCGSARGW